MHRVRWLQESYIKLNQFIPPVHYSNIVNFRIPSPNWPHICLTTATLKLFNYVLICMNLYQYAKNESLPSVNSWDTFKFIPKNRLATLIFDHPQPKTFQSTFNSCELVSTCKKIRLFHWFVVEKQLI